MPCHPRSIGSQGRTMPYRTAAKRLKEPSYEPSVDLAPCVRGDIRRRPGWNDCSAFVVGTSLAARLQGRCKNGNWSDWHIGRACAGSVDCVRKKLLRSENRPGQTNDRHHHPSGRSACAVWSRCKPCSKSPAAEHSADG